MDKEIILCGVVMFTSNKPSNHFETVWVDNDDGYQNDNETNNLIKFIEKNNRPNRLFYVTGNGEVVRYKDFKKTTYLESNGIFGTYFPDWENIHKVILPNGDVCTISNDDCSVFMMEKANENWALFEEYLRNSPEISSISASADEDWRNICDNAWDFYSEFDVPLYLIDEHKRILKSLLED